jgi:diguanylate cyclase (GGDEF)-like protein/PAS domain S-box-containing protein
MKKSIMLFTILLVFLTVGSLTTILTLNSHQLVKENFTRVQQQVLLQSNMMLSEFLEAQKARVDLWASQPVIDVYFNTPGLRELSRPGLDLYFANIGQSVHWLDNIFLLDGRDIAHAYSRPGAPGNTLSVPELTPTILDAPEWSVVNTSPEIAVSSAAKLLLKRPYLGSSKNEPGKYIAVLIDLNAVQKKLFAGIRIGSGGFVQLLAKGTDKGIWVSSFDGDESIGNSPVARDFLQASREWFTWDDIDQDYSSFGMHFMEVHQGTLAVATIFSKQDLMNPVISQIRSSIILGVVIVLLGGLAAVYLTDRLHKPLLRFIDNINNVGIYKLDSKKFADSASAYSEIRSMNKAFKKMLEYLDQSNEQLKREEIRYRELFENNEISIWNQDFSEVSTRLNQLRAQGVRHLRQYFEENPQAAWDLVRVIRVNQVNNASLMLFKASSEQQLRLSMDKIFAAGAIDVYINLLCAIWEHKDTFHSDTTLRTLDGELIYVVVSMQLPSTEEGFRNVPVSYLDITKRKLTEQALIENENKYRTLVESAPMCIHQIDTDGKLLSMNRAGLEMIGNSSEQSVLGTPYISLACEEDRERIAKLITAGIAGQFSEFEFRGTSGSEFSSNFVPIHETDGKVDRLLGITQDISEKKHAQDKLSFQASHDALTGLINRREFERRANRLLKSFQHNPTEHAMCFLDLDRFKVINDTCGHPAGDELLRQISEILRNTVRKRDTLARLGGDEFGVLMEHCSLDHAKRVADDILKALNNHQFSWEEEVFRVGASIGLVAITESTANFTELFKRADAACYFAKELGRNRVHVAHPEDADLAVRHGEMRWVGRINQALDEDRFCLYAQPIVALESSDHKHYELLIRMLDEQGVIILPGAFLPAAERYDLIGKLDAWVLTHACAFLAANPEFVRQIEFVSINLSGASLTNQDLLLSFQQSIEESGVAPDKFCFEVTETVAVSNLGTAARFITILKQTGCRFALDDFGSGISSFGYLKNLPVDYLKIDGMFVQDMVDDPIDHAMVRSINEIGQIMGIKTIAEFVENDAILEMLKAIGVDYAQGFGLGKPEPLENLADTPSLPNCA